MAPNVLTLREHDTAQIGDCWDPVNRVLPGSFVAQLEQLQATYKIKAFNISRRTVKAQQFVGTVCINGQAIDILPKIDRDESGARNRLVQMLEVAGLVPHRPVGLGLLHQSQSTLLDSYLRLYVEQLAFEWRRGHIANYRKVAKNRSYLRGKLLFTENLRQNLLRPERFFTQADEFIQDVPLPQLLKAGLRVCAQHATGLGTQREALQLLGELGHIGDRTFAVSELSRLQVDRRSQRFAPLVELAKLFLANQVPDRPGSAHTYGLVFDMNVVFERYIGQLLARSVCPPERIARLQLSEKSLLREGTTPRFRLKPDAAIYEGPRLTCLIDTKWKRLDKTQWHDSVKQSDIYQSYAYGKEYEAPAVVLLYPRTADFGAIVRTYRQNPGDADSPKIIIATVDVSLPPTGESSVAKELGELLTGCVPSASPVALG